MAKIDKIEERPGASTGEKFATRGAITGTIFATETTAVKHEGNIEAKFAMPDVTTVTTSEGDLIADGTIETIDIDLIAGGIIETIPVDRTTIIEMAVTIGDTNHCKMSEFRKSRIFGCGFFVLIFDRVRATLIHCPESAKSCPNSNSSPKR